jgi:O-antigen/teichoic acid export membrane protein
MLKSRIVENIFSNWASLVVSIAISFLVTPIIVHSLGNETYGTWTLIASVTGYFTVLDFGVNTAIVRYISSSYAQNDHEQARKVYSTSLAIFAAVALILLIFSVVFGFFFQTLFKLYQIPQLYLYTVFLFSAMDLAFGLLFSVYLGALSGLQEFKFINGSSIIINILKSVAVVYLLTHGYGLLTLALLQVGSTLVRAFCQYWRIKTGYKFLFFRRKYITRETVKHIYNYSIYSFIIAIALKLLFYTDSLVIGSMIGVSDVTFYAIPSSLLDYLEKFVWAMIAVLVPVISANEAAGKEGGNVNLYVVGTRYSLLVSMPVVISLYFYGNDFITLWMGAEIGERSRWVLRLLLIGFGFALSQLIAHGILKGISRHKVLAFILAIEAVVNLGMSVALAKPYGIEGVAFGTMVPLIVASLVIIGYTCRLLQIKLWLYIVRSYSGAVAGLLAALVAVYFIDGKSHSYAGVFLKSGMVTVVFLAVALPLCLCKDQRDAFVSKIGFSSKTPVQ